MIHRLDSLDHDGLLPYASLVRTNRTRHEDWFIAEGRWVVERLLASRHEVISVVVGDQAERSFIDRISQHVTTFLLPRDLVSRLVGFPFHAGIIACGRRTALRSLEGTLGNDNAAASTVVVCPATVLPDNLGSIIRLSTAFGANAIIVGPLSADPWSRRTVRVSMGNIFQIPVIEPESPAALETMLRQLSGRYGFHLIAATGRAGADTLPMPRPAPRIAIVLGNEAHGIDERLVSLCQQEVSIPMSGATDSLNVSNAAAILLYQFSRVSPG